LPCGHSICQTYIEKFYKKEQGTIKCPYDNAIHKYRERKDIPKNFDKIGLLEELRKGKPVITEFSAKLMKGIDD